MPKRGIASFFNSLPKKQRTNADDQLPSDAAKTDDPSTHKAQQKRLSPSQVRSGSKVPQHLLGFLMQLNAVHDHIHRPVQRRKAATPPINLTGPPTGSTRQEPLAARKQQFIRVLGDGGDSQAAALK